MTNRSILLPAIFRCIDGSVVGAVEEKVGALVARVAPHHPQAARRILEVAYSYVDAKRYFSSPHTFMGATNRYNAAIARCFVRGFRKPQQSVMVNIFFPCELLHAAHLNVLFPEGLSVYLACTYCATYFLDVAEDHAVPESLCSYHKATLGIAQSGVLPAPGYIANTTLVCDANNVTFRACQELYQTPHAVIDVPREVNEASVAYIKEQLVTIADALARHFGVEITHERLVEVCRRSKHTLELLRDFAHVREKTSLPTSLTSELCMLVATHCLLGTSESEQYFAQLLVLAEKEVGHEKFGKPRVFWVHTLPNWQLPATRLFDNAKRAELVGNDMCYDAIGVLDELNPEDPFDFMARKLVYCSANGDGSRRIAQALSLAKQLQAQGIILFGQGGCRQTLALAQMMQKAATQAGLAFLELDGDGCDERLAFDGQVATRLETFVEQLNQQL